MSGYIVSVSNTSARCRRSHLPGDGSGRHGPGQDDGVCGYRLRIPAGIGCELVILTVSGSGIVGMNPPTDRLLRLHQLPRDVPPKHDGIAALDHSTPTSHIENDPIDEPLCAASARAQVLETPKPVVGSRVSLRIDADGQRPIWSTAVDLEPEAVINPRRGGPDHIESVGITPRVRSPYYRFGPSWCERAEDDEDDDGQRPQSRKKSRLYVVISLIGSGTCPRAGWRLRPFVGEG